MNVEESTEISFEIADKTYKALARQEFNAPELALGISIFLIRLKDQAETDNDVETVEKWLNSFYELFDETKKLVLGKDD